MRRLALVVTLAAGCLAALFAPSARASAQPSTAAEVGRTANVRYGEDSGQPLLLDVYRPSGSGTHAAVILVHGGGWVEGSKASVAYLAAALARGGFVTFAVDYALATTGHPGYPRQIGDIEQAISWVRANGPRYGAAPDRLALMGSSAGAYLVAMAGLAEPAAVRSIVMLSGPTDLPTLGTQVELQYHGRCGPSCVQDRSLHINTFLGCDISTCPGAFLRAASPVTHVTRRSPPFFIANSTDELVPVGQLRQMAGRLRASGVRVETEVLPGSRHGNAYVASIRAPLDAFLLSTTGSNGGFPWVPMIVGVVAAFVVVCVIGWLLWRRRRRSSTLPKGGRGGRP